MNVTAYAASVGHSVWFSHDVGETWNRAHTNTGGIYNESRCWCVAVHPGRPGEVLSGTDLGVYRWDPGPGRWNHVPSPMDGLHILQMARAPHDPGIIFAGTRPAEIYRSLDDGRTWTRCRLGNSTECFFINTPRVTSIQFDPEVPETVWVSIEIDGVYRSRDLGETWEKLNDGLVSDDTHNLVFFDSANGKRELLCSTEEGLHKSTDNGANWRLIEVPEAPFVYMRCMARRADDSEIVFMSVGDRPSGETGMLLRSRDRGETWENVDLGARVNSTIWSIGTNPADPDLIFCCTIMGQIFRSTDGGEAWRKMTRELGELRMIAWQPAAEG
jgi:photosystem II stability/assembly factor-like uncharacterized protein